MIGLLRPRRKQSSRANTASPWTHSPRGSNSLTARRIQEEQMMQAKPTSLRWWILLLLFLAMTVNIIDRQVLSLVAPILRDRFHFSNTEYGTIVLCFLLGMTLSQL